MGSGPVPGVHVTVSLSHRWRKFMSATASPLLEGFSYPTLKPLIKQSLKAKSTVLLRGNPGVGKSSLANEISDEFGMQMIDIRAAQKDPAERSSPR
jgi:ribosome biogenesis GTPase A